MINTAEIQDLKITLNRIQLKQPVFFNITVYQNLGLVFSRNKYKKNAVGNKYVVGTNWYLTVKAKQILENLAN